MEITIGLHDNPREIHLEVDMEAADLLNAIRDAKANHDYLFLSDKKGKRQVIVSGKAIAYVEVGKDTADKLGFGIA